MPLHLSKATEADLPAIVRGQYAAFHPHETLHVLIYPSPNPPTDNVIQSTIARHLKTWREDRTVNWIKITDEETGTIVAASKWCIFPEADPKRFQDKVDVYWVPDPAVASEQQFSGGGVGDEAYISWIMEGFFDHRRERMLGPGVLIDILFTHPNWHRKGAGKMMLDWGAKVADELGVISWVEASYTGQRLYRSGGFEPLREVVLEGGKEKEEWSGFEKVGYWFMERQPKTRVKLEQKDLL
jgi:GNAT superfamily N-acetyltransferase